MLLSISTTHNPATDLGYLLAKHPDKHQTFKLAYGDAHVFYPEADDSRCTACLLLDLDPVGLVRGRRRHGEGTLTQYVNDRPYVASSFLSVAIARVFSSALKGNSRERPELVTTPLPLEVAISLLPCRDGTAFLCSLFAPLGYLVDATRVPLDETFPEWGQGPYFRVTLSKTAPLSEVLTHLYVLLPVLDNNKHYWVGRDELEKLLERGAGWLSGHPEYEVIVQRYLKHQRGLAREAIERLLADEDIDPDTTDEVQEQEELTIETPLTLNEQRLGTVMAVLKEAGARQILDLGCGEGRLLSLLLRDKSFTRITGVDVSYRGLEIATQRLKLDRMPDRQRKRTRLFQASLVYRDDRFAGYDAVCAIEVIEHIDESRLPAFERVLFEFASPQTVVITTPNAEYNVHFASLPAGQRRHRDHRFEWSRRTFEDWACRVAAQYHYAVRFVPIGPVDADVGPPTQMGLFSR